MKNLKGTKTENNIIKAIIFESKNYHTFSMFEEQAKREGLEEISLKFKEIADQEKSHASLLTNLIKEGNYEINYSLFFPKLGNTLENLFNAVKTETHEFQDIYPGYAKTAREEGFLRIEEIFQMLTQVENCHHMELKKYHDMLKNNTLFKKDKVIKWKCINCGRELDSQEAPDKCPLCDHKQGYFKEDPDQNSKKKKNDNKK